VNLTLTGRSGIAETPVWYAAYASNLAWDRLRCYIYGGSPRGSSQQYAGCRLKRDPSDDLAVQCSRWNEVTETDLTGRVARVVDACDGNEALLDCLWQVMEGDDEGVSRAEIVRVTFGGDLSLFERGQVLIEAAWRQGGVQSDPSNLISETSDGRLIMFGPARNVVYELLDTD
jgi:hypothetical protein